MIKIKEDNIKISFIIPFNYAKDNDFIKDSLNSILNQTLDNFEIICINNSSEDLSSNFNTSDKNIKIIDGIGNINLFDMIKGEYVSFINPNDLFMLISFDLLYDYAISNDLDLIFYPSSVLDSNGNSVDNDYFDYSVIASNKNICLNQKDITNFLFFIAHDIFNVLYKTSFIKELNFTFDLNNMFDNAYLFFKTILNSNKIAMFNNTLSFKRMDVQPIYNNEIQIGDPFTMSINENCNFDFINNCNFINENNDGFTIESIINIFNLFVEMNLYSVYSRNLINYVSYAFKRVYYNSNDKENVFKLIKQFYIKHHENFKFILNLDVSNLFFYRTILKSNNPYDFELYYKIQSLKIHRDKLFYKNEILENEINELKYYLNNNSNKEKHSLNKVSRVLQDKNRYLTLKNRRLIKENKDLKENIKSKKGLFN